MSSLDNEEKWYYLDTFTASPNELDVVGSGYFCCIPLGKN